MNKVILQGRLTRDPDIRYSQAAEPMAIAKYSLAVNRKFKRDGEPEADFINCVAFKRQGEFAEKYLQKGILISVVGRMQTGSYTNKEGVKVYTTDVIVEDHYFAESKKERATTASAPKADSKGFVPVDDLDDDDIPF